MREVLKPIESQRLYDADDINPFNENNSLTEEERKRLLKNLSNNVGKKVEKFEKEIILAENW